MNRFGDKQRSVQHKPLSLHLCGNEALGDAGAAALAAALRTSASDNTPNDEATTVVFDILDLSSCDIGDAGAEALAMALESHPLCIRHLDLSNNCISDEGLAAIAAALLKSNGNSISLESVDLSNNKDVGDRGAAEIAKAMELGKLMTVSLRSCHVRADGAEAFAQALKGLSLLGSSALDPPRKIDLSGNPLGVLRNKKKDSGKYSATRLKSKASATASSYMSFIGKNIRSGLKDVGLDLGSSGPSPESDDDEEERMGDSVNGDEDLDPAKARCGAKSFASVIFDGDGNKDDDEALENTPSPREHTVRCDLAMRHCFLDQGAADALAAVILRAKERLGIDLSVDVRMNNVLESDMVAALKGDAGYDSYLDEMAERHMAAMETIRIAKERAVEAAEAISSRIGDLHVAWSDEEDDAFGGGSDDYDSDAIYDDSDDY